MIADQVRLRYLRVSRPLTNTDGRWLVRMRPPHPVIVHASILDRVPQATVQVRHSSPIKCSSRTPEVVRADDHHLKQNGLDQLWAIERTWLRSRRVLYLCWLRSLCILLWHHVRVGFHLTVSKLINRTTELNKNNKEISDNSQSRNFAPPTLGCCQCCSRFILYYYILAMGVFSSRVSQTQFAR